ncbi:hypothetical protein GXP67_25680 [Rhodocytophaga rosea]|uniref:Yeast cell wall synthesis Kre9/Knh1-like N-terminal domain-containing protein n=1 Tax=Rhodocytophaga rosea TaxID=2704465 RepID=A0A6C0GQA9_9BACT|nr:GPI anchored serine-threonine rich family protein [Rhodocytophaga rosea]QHT69793.1 hypothetical protein GXP67_25680 [Rhodocytophaga rosea]
MKVFTAGLLLYLMAYPAFSQQISNVRATADSAFVTILYDLQGTIEGQLFTVELYGSHNEYNSPLLYVTGEVGNKIKAGKNKKMVWQTRELNNFEGDITFDVRAELAFSPFAVKSPGKTSGYKRGKTYQIEWAGGLTSDKVNVELYRNDVKISSITSTANKGKHSWNVPDKSKPGGNYQLRVSSEANPDNFSLSRKFSIRRRIPLLAKVLPFALVGAGAYIILNQDSGPPPPPQKILLPEPDVPQ